MAVGSLALWIGIPVGSLWLAAKLTDSKGAHFLLTLPMTIVAMGGFAVFLAWLNGLYLAVIGPQETEEGAPPARGPLERMLVWSLVVALLALFGWFFFLAENPSELVY
jgi:hypothetical protein